MFNEILGILLTSFLEQGGSDASRDAVLLYTFYVYNMKRTGGIRMQVRHNITIDAEVSRELEDLAEELGEKKSGIIEKALTAYFDLLDLQVAAKRLRDLTKGKAKLIDAEDVWKDLGL